MEQRDMPKADFITSIVLIVFSVGVVWMSFHMPRFENRGANPLSVPGIVPGILGFIIGGLSLVMLVRSLKQKGYRQEITGGKLVTFFKKDPIIRLILTLVLTLFYGWGLIGRVFYPLGTFVFVALFIIIFEYDRKKSKKEKTKTVLIALLEAFLVSAIVSGVFRYLFLVDLP